MLRPGSSADHLVVQFAQCAVSIPSDRWPLIKALFEQLAELPAPARAAALQAAGLDTAEAAELQSLLQHHDQSQGTGGFLADSAALALVGSAAHTGQRLGAWQIVRPLGAGGMGEVFEAHRADGSYQGRAAVKLLKRGMDSAAVLQRFAQERQALARLSHPHIARLLDAGASADGLPYFVLEYVDGQPIDLAVHGLPLEARLALFLQLADAVAHAHRNLLVHRDLKPGNVLVDSSGQVKLLDFGIAKALDPLDSGGNPGDADKHATVGGARPYTPNYASPEQVRGEPVTTATDIYSLGVLLYQMLTGTRPTGRHATTPAEAARSVLEDTPTRPSSLASDQTPDPLWLQTRKHLAGDLDNILLKALEKAPEQRYASVDALAADVRAHLAGYPVSARPLRAGYLLSRFIGRNKASVAAASVAVLAVLGGAAAALWQAQLAQTQRVLAERRFDEVRQFARTMLFDVDTALRDGPTAGREKLVSTALQYLDRLSAERLSDAGLLRDVAEAYERVGDIQGNTMQSNLGRPKDARQSQDKALALREQAALLAPTDQANLAGLASTHERLGDLARSQGDLPGAARHYSAAVQRLATLAAARPGDVAAQLRHVQARRYLASVHYWPFHNSLGQYTQARPEIEALVAELAALAQRHPDNADVLAQYGALLNQLTEFQRISGEFAATLATQRTSNAVATRLLALAPDNPRWQRWLALAEGYLADALLGTGDSAAGVALWQASIQRREALARADPNDERTQRSLANGYGPLAEALDALGRHPEALVWYTRENSLLRQQRAKHPGLAALRPRLDESDRDLALQLLLNGRVVDAVAMQRALDVRRAGAGNTAIAAPADADDGKFALLRAQVLLAPGAPGVTPAEQADALAQARAGLAMLRKAATAEPFNMLLAREVALGAHTLAVASAAQDPAAACTLAREAVATLDRLASAGKLPATVMGQRTDARRRATACGVP